MSADSQPTFSYKQTFVLGLGLFIISVAAALYNSFVPLFLKHYIGSSGVIGLIVAFRTLSGIVLNLYFSARSDRTMTRFGRRIPYIMIGMPVSALLFVALPWQYGAAFLITIDILYAFSSNIFYAPVITLMPDITPPESRSKANGIINLMGGIGALLTYFAGAALFKLNRDLPFFLVGILFLVVTFLLARYIREPRDVRPSSSVAFRHIWNTGREVLRSADVTGRNLLTAIFLWTFAQSTIETFFVTYTVYYLHLPASAGTISIGLFSLAFLVFAVPAGFLAARIGRRQAIAGGLVLFTVLLAALTLVHSLLLLRVLILLGGIAWALINVNAYPWVTNLTKDKVGAYTGLYMLAGGVAGVLGQPTIGFLMDRFGYPALFGTSAIACGLAFIFILRTPREGRGQPKGMASV